MVCLRCGFLVFDGRACSERDSLSGVFHHIAIVVSFLLYTYNKKKVQICYRLNEENTIFW